MSSYEQIVKQLEKILVQSKKEQWPYPKIFETIKNLGVTSYTVEVATHDIRHNIGKYTWKESCHSNFKELTVNSIFCKETVLKALELARKKEIDYEGFLKHIANAGVQKYIVNMATRTVTYYGILSNEYYAEKVLEYTLNN